MAELQWIEGRISVEAAVRAGNRPVEVIYIRRDRRDSATSRLQQFARKSGVAVERVSAETITEYAAGHSHGGVLARVGPRRFQELATLLEGQPDPAVVMIDGVEDPFNFGQAVRALYAAGVSGLVVRPRNWLSAADVVTRASAGASEWMPMAVAESVEKAADFFGSRGLTIACAARDATATVLFEADLTRPLFLVVGGEKRGITRTFMKRAEMRLEIPYGRPFTHALGTSSSVAVLAFEMMRQKRQSGKQPYQ
jgi:23S rRNA (guanosine2251-2'-O)-methyltransferase